MNDDLEAMTRQLAEFLELLLRSSDRELREKAISVMVNDDSNNLDALTSALVLALRSPDPGLHKKTIDVIKTWLSTGESL